MVLAPRPRWFVLPLTLLSLGGSMVCGSAVWASGEEVERGSPVRALAPPTPSAASPSAAGHGIETEGPSDVADTEDPSDVADLTGPADVTDPVDITDTADIADITDITHASHLLITSTDLADLTNTVLSHPSSEAEPDAEPEAEFDAEPEADPIDLDAPPLTAEDLDLFRDPELGVIRVRNPLEDPELGILRIREQPDLPVAAAPPKVAFLTARFSLVNSDNVLLVVNDVGGLTGDTFYRPAVTIAAYPSLGPETVLIGSLDAGLQRYTSQPSINYDDWRVRLALRQGLSPRSYIQVGATYQELLRAGGSRFRFFDNRAVALTLGRRDPLTPTLALDSFYQVQWNDARSRSQSASGIVVTDFSRLGQTAGVYLGYTPSSQWHTGLSYQLNLIDYTTQDRYDTIQQLLGQVVYSITPQVRLSLYGGWSFGRSSDPRINFNDTILGITIDATVPLF